MESEREDAVEKVCHWLGAVVVIDLVLGLKAVISGNLTGGWIAFGVLVGLIVFAFTWSLCLAAGTADEARGLQEWQVRNVDEPKNE